MYLSHFSICIAINLIAFIPAALLQTDAFYDVTASATTIAVIVSCLARIDTTSDAVRPSILALMLVGIWTARLGLLLGYRIHKLGHDSRMDKVKKKPKSFWIMWAMQGVWVFVITLPAQVLTFREADVDVVGPRLLLSVTGLLLWATGFSIEAIADWQKLRFRLSPANKGKFITTGLFRYARYPNYFGEITLWSGLALFSASHLTSAIAIAAAACSPLITYLLLVYASGIPIQERQAAERWGDDPEFKRYRETTPLLLPLPRM